MKIGLGQINTTVGDLEGNVRRCLDAIRRGTALGAELVVLPEMAVPGYPPRDILYDDSFVQAVLAATDDLAIQARGLCPALVGSMARSGERPPGHPGLHNAAYFLRDGAAQVVATKQLLPVYDVFLEPRWFLPGGPMPPVEMAGHKLGILICEDMWDEGYRVHPAQELRAAGAEMLLCLSALPYRKRVMQNRVYHAERHGLPLALCNLVGGNDELIFDGRSFAVDEGGRVTVQIPGFEEAVQVVEMPPSASLTQAESEPAAEQELFDALALGLRDFARKNGMRGAFIGLSGGVDSSVAAVLAARALGAENVTGVAIPSRYTDARSTEAARELSAALGIRFEVVEMESIHKAVEDSLGELLEGGSAAENAQARLRMLVLMAYVNKRGGFLINTSNKTELTLGYGTLYGDLAGAISPLGDVTKPEVYALARHINACIIQNGIPAYVLERAPTAELKPGQVDPFDYETLGPELEALVLADRSNAAMRRSEHKRQQFGIVLKVSERAFGSGRLVPIARK